jgi:FkbM family methyltransferase
MSLQRRSSIPLRLIAFSLLALSVLMLTATISPKVRLSMVWAAGRCSGCSFRDAVASHDLLVKMADVGREIGAASRVIETDPKEIELVETPQGRYWTVHNDKFLRFALAEQKLAIYGEHASGVHRGDIVFDCGANVGIFTRTALQEGAQLVVAVEPAPKTVECLRRNLKQEIADGRVVVVPKGVWDKPDLLELAEGGEGNSTGDSFVFGRDNPNKVQVPLTTIDIIAAELKLLRVDFIKMDIEGAEKQALTGATQSIRRYHPRMAIASEHLPDDVTAIPALVSRLATYTVKSSSCKDGFLWIKPEVLLFQPR